MPAADLLALDVGGAAIKAADGRGWAASLPFALWREWRRLPVALAEIVRAAGAGRIVATMTGEICDCYASRAAGVAHIVDALEAAADGRPLGIYMLDGRIATPKAARERPLEASASNWHALARLAAAHAPADRALLLDIGSTTTDVVPIVAGRPAPRAHDDAGRMLLGELVYTGVERTPLSALVRRLPHRGTVRPVAAERFADSRDAWLLLGLLPEDAAAVDTADGAPATRAAARVRLARTMLVEQADFSSADAEAAAARCARVQARLVARALARAAAAVGTPEHVVLSGHGEPLARMALDLLGWTMPATSLTRVLGAEVSRAAPAHALALIARRELP